MDKINMRKEISIKEYPYEMYCRTCGKVEAFCKEEAISGEAIRIEGKIKPDGSKINAGDIMKCNCKVGIARSWWTRKRFSGILNVITDQENVTTSGSSCTLNTEDIRTAISTLTKNLEKQRLFKIKVLHNCTKKQLQKLFKWKLPNLGKSIKDFNHFGMPICKRDFVPKGTVVITENTGRIIGVMNLDK